METHTELQEYIHRYSRAIKTKRYSPVWTNFMLAFVDFCTMIVSIWLALGIYRILDISSEGFSSSILVPLLLAFGSTYILVAVFRSRNINQVEELRQLTITTTIIFLTLTVFNGMADAPRYPAGVFGLSWLFTLVAAPTARIITRTFGSKMGIFGEPVVIIGSGDLSRKIVNYLLKRPACGMKPLMVVDGLAPDTTASKSKEITVPVVSLKKWPVNSNLGSRLGASTAIVVAPDLPLSINESIARGEHLGFSKIIIVNKHYNTRSFGITPHDFGGVLGFEERHYELNHLEDWLIRIFDLTLILLSLPLLAPFFILIMAAIKLDSKGSIFYRQTRIGKGGKSFKVLKFRTMVKDADKVLEKYLQESPELLAEWQASHKLKDDPRITRVGNFLRKTSIDELPQLWNVLKGEMSLIGPRPIVAEEIERYGDRYKYYIQVPPGLSGLWQVSGRSDVGYRRRVKLDEYYVRNRSFWLNLHIIIRTFLAVVRRHGAY